MQHVLIGVLGVLLYASGLLVWPVCLIVWRKRRRRTPVLRWTFIAEVLCQFVLVGFSVFSHGLLEHQYYWFMIMIMVNLGFTPLALGAAFLDYASDRQSPAA